MKRELRITINVLVSASFEYLCYGSTAISYIKPAVGQRLVFAGMPIVKMWWTTIPPPPPDARACLAVNPLDMPRTPYWACEGKRSQ